MSDFSRQPPAFDPDVDPSAMIKQICAYLVDLQEHVEFDINDLYRITGNEKGKGVK